MEPRDNTTRAVAEWLEVHPDADLVGYSIRRRIARIHAIVDNEINELVALHGFDSYGDYALVSTIRRSPIPLRPRQLAKDLLLTPAGVTGRLERTGRIGFIQREPASNDARGYVVRCTDLGRERTDAAFKAIESYDTHRFVISLGADEPEILARLLGTLAAGLDSRGM